MRKLLSALLLFLVVCGMASAQDEQSPYEIALQRIEEARVNDYKGLQLENIIFTELPSEIGQLVNLQRLDLSVNALTSLPPEFSKLVNLHTLDLDLNEFTSIPLVIFELKNLRNLNMFGNMLSTIPHEIRELQNLCTLDISFNNLTHLPYELGFLRQLESGYCWLNVEGNPLISPPPEVVSQGTGAILEYLRNEAWWHLQRLIAGGASFAGMLAATILGLRWKNRRGKGKKKNEEKRAA